MLFRLAIQTKIGGEVEASIVEPYSNKQHHGFLGHSYLGSWINLGAGTCNSDLKNTYGASTGSIPPGKPTNRNAILGLCHGRLQQNAQQRHLYRKGDWRMQHDVRIVTSNVPSFVNYARLFGQMTTLPPEVMTCNQQRMFARRKVEQRPSDMQLIFEMYRLTQARTRSIRRCLAF